MGGTMADDAMADLSAALDEIYLLRKMLATEARILEAHTEYKAFPKTRLKFAKESVERMREMARGNAHAAWYRGSPEYRFARQELESIAGSGTLTRAEFQYQQAKRDEARSNDKAAE
jgi:hypothetical protein